MQKPRTFGSARDKALGNAPVCSTRRDCRTAEFCLQSRANQSRSTTMATQYLVGWQGFRRIASGSGSRAGGRRTRKQGLRTGQSRRTNEVSRYRQSGRGLGGRLKDVAVSGRCRSLNSVGSWGRLPSLARGEQPRPCRVANQIAQTPPERREFLWCPPSSMIESDARRKPETCFRTGRPKPNKGNDAQHSRLRRCADDPCTGNPGATPVHGSMRATVLGT